MPNKFKPKSYYFLVPVYASESDMVPFIDINESIPSYVSDDYKQAIKIGRDLSQKQKTAYGVVELKYIVGTKYAK